ncbi:MAG: hypothetical protein FWC78_05410 [Defluviitaleaceae bacterium]|nr:hypothetical protein [Defluviitaleaceae bacterium]
MKIRVFEAVTAAGLENSVNKFLEENQGLIEVKDLKYRLTTATHGVIIVYEDKRSSTPSWN